MMDNKFAPIVPADQLFLLLIDQFLFGRRARLFVILLVGGNTPGTFHPVACLISLDFILPYRIDEGGLSTS
jgi:hypothetical protein